MNPKFSNILEQNEVLHFTLSGVNVSLANALRRIIIAEIPTVVVNSDLQTDPPQCNIMINTGRIHNEMLKQRLACIPVHTKDLKFIENYTLELDVKNESDTIIYVTTEDFEIRDKNSGNLLPKDQSKTFFPTCLKTNSFIDFTRLKPKISTYIPGEQLKMTAQFSVGIAKQNSCFNVVSKCTFGNTPNIEKITKTWDDVESKLRSQEVSDSDIKFQKSNFMILDAQRIFIPDSYDFMIKSVGVFENTEIVRMGSKILYEKFIKFMEDLDSDTIPILNSETTIDFCFDIILEDEDYTMGKVLEYFLYEKYYIGKSDSSAAVDKMLQKLSFCGFKKFHPHDENSTVRIAFRETADKIVAKQVMRDAAVDAQDIFKSIYKSFRM